MTLTCLRQHNNNQDWFTIQIKGTTKNKFRSEQTYFLFDFLFNKLAALLRDPRRFLSNISLSWRTNIPCLALHLKYGMPLTDPLFFPKIE